MATINGSTSSSVWTFKLVTKEGAYNIDKNTSPLTVEVYIGRSSSSSGSYMQGAEISCTIKVTDCTNQTLSYHDPAKVNVASGGWLYIGSKTFTVPHNADGSKTVTVSASFTCDVIPNSGSASGSVTLATIPRATTPVLSATSVTMGSGMTITLTPANNSFKHKLRYTFGSLSSQVAGFSEGNDFTPAGTRTVTFTPPASLGSQIPNATSGTCTIYCYTYTSSGTHIGTKSKTVTLSVPSYSVSAIVAITGNALLGGMYVNGKSTVTATITASTSYGATIKSYSSTVGGKTYSGATFTSGILTTGNGQYVATTVTDSRGKTITVKSSTFAVYAYSVPYITTLSAVRQSDGTTVVVTLKGGVSSVNGQNGKSFSVTLNGVTNTLTSTGFTIDATTTFTNVNTDSTFEVVAKISDHYTYATKTAVLPTVAVTLDFHHSGTGVAMGKVAEKEKTLDMAWQIRSSGTFNQNSWGKPNKGAITQVIDESGAQHSAVVGVNANDERVYSIEFYDMTDNPNVRIYAGSDYMSIGKAGFTYNNYSIPYLVPIWSGTLYTTGATATLNQSIANFKYLEIYFHDNDGYYDSVRIRNAKASSMVAVVGHTAIGSSGYIKQLILTFNGTTATVSNNKQIAISTTTGTGAANNGVITAGQFITIDAIVGIK